MQFRAFLVLLLKISKEIPAFEKHPNNTIPLYNEKHPENKTTRAKTPEFQIFNVNLYTIAQTKFKTKKVFFLVINLKPFLWKHLKTSVQRGIP